MKKTALITLAVVVAAIGVAQARTRYEAPLSGTGKGKAKFDVRSNQAELEVEAERLARNAAYVVKIGAMAPIPVATNGFGQLRVVRRWGRTGQPAISTGTPVQISTAAGVSTLTGSFAPR